jgi:hypothetical protein
MPTCVLCCCTHVDISIALPSPVLSIRIGFNAYLELDPGSQPVRIRILSGSWSDFEVTKSKIFTLKILLLYRYYIESTGTKGVGNQVYFVNFGQFCGSESVFPIRIRIWIQGAKLVRIRSGSWSDFEVNKSKMFTLKIY